MEKLQLKFALSLLKDTLENHLAAPYKTSQVSVSYYDMAWLLRLENPDNPTKPLFPDSIEKLLQAQASNGSWGHQARAGYICDTLITSLSAVLGLQAWRELDKRIPTAITKAETCINVLLKQVQEDAYKSVGFEMLLPALLEEALDKGLALLIPSEIDAIIQQRKLKLASFPLELLYQKPTTLLHSLEAFYKIPLDWEKLAQVQDRNGAFLSSPAATAKVYQETGNPKSLAYLLDLAKSGTIPVNTPIDIFEVNWSLEIIYQLGLAPELSQAYKRGLEMLRLHWTDKGISWSSQFDLPDLDNTSVAFYLLSLAGQAPSPDVFKHFYNDESIYCFYGELDSSPTHLLHFLQALLQMPEQAALRQRVLDKLLALFEENHWRDKWHLSPYYTIALSIQPLSQLHPPTVNAMLDYVLETAPTSLEETAWLCYALYQALDNLSFSTAYRQCLETALDAGIAYLETAYLPDTVLENLWIDKCLYAPYSIVQTLVNAVLLRSRTTDGKRPKTQLL